MSIIIQLKRCRKIFVIPTVWPALFYHHAKVVYGWPALSWPSEAFSEGGSEGFTNNLYVLLSE
jgi:hypothetical protein